MQSEKKLVYYAIFHEIDIPNPLTNPSGTPGASDYSIDAPYLSTNASSFEQIHIISVIYLVEFFVVIQVPTSASVALL